MRTIGFAAMALAAASTAAPAASDARNAVEQVLARSAEAWNAGDLDRFMTCYENSHLTTYVGGGGRVVSGYAAIRDMYASRFGGGSAAAMGHLTLAIVSFRQVGRDHAYVIGRFTLHREGQSPDAEGPTTLLFHRTPAGWRIAADHS